MKKILTTLISLIGIAFLLSCNDSKIDIDNVNLKEENLSKGYLLLEKLDEKKYRNCCRICKKGKACGDSCINKNYTCTKPPGCACNG